MVTYVHLLSSARLQKALENASWLLVTLSSLQQCVLASSLLQYNFTAHYERELMPADHYEALWQHWAQSFVHFKTRLGELLNQIEKVPIVLQCEQQQLQENHFPCSLTFVTSVTD